MKKRKTSQFPVALMVAGGLFLVLFIALLIVQNRTPPAAQAPENRGGIERVTLLDAKSALESNSAVFIDVRSQEAYNALHISGALSIPETEIQARLNELDPDQWIIPYCT
jgi:hypothetical protein